MALIATQILSLKQWHYLKADNNDLDWYKPEWLKETALEFAISYTKLQKRNDKFLN